MRAAKKAIVDKNLLQDFVPLNALSSERFRELSEKIIIEDVLEGRFLFHEGDKDNHSIFGSSEKLVGKNIANLKQER